MHQEGRIFSNTHIPYYILAILNSDSELWREKQRHLPLPAEGLAVPFNYKARESPAGEALEMQLEVDSPSRCFISAQ